MAVGVANGGSDKVSRGCGVLSTSVGEPNGAVDNDNKAVDLLSRTVDLLRRGCDIATGGCGNDSEAFDIAKGSCGVLSKAVGDDSSGAQLPRRAAQVLSRLARKRRGTGLRNVSQLFEVLSITILNQGNVFISPGGATHLLMALSGINAAESPRLCVVSPETLQGVFAAVPRDTLF